MVKATFVLDKLTNEVCYVNRNNSCGKCLSDIWFFHYDDGRVLGVSSPRHLCPNYNFFVVSFNRKHFDRKTKQYNLCTSYSELIKRVSDKKYFYPSSYMGDDDFPLYKEIDSGYEPKRLFSLLIWSIISSFLIGLPFIHLGLSKKDTRKLIKYMSYILPQDTIYFDFYDNKLFVDLYISRNKIMLKEIDYDDKCVLANVSLYLNDEYNNFIIKSCSRRELPWARFAIKKCLPFLYNEIINKRIEQIL
jgi:hypothetical protein